jgi:hypothetical protein
VLGKIEYLKVDGKTSTPSSRTIIFLENYVCGIFLPIGTHSKPENFPLAFPGVFREMAKQTFKRRLEATTL